MTGYGITEAGHRQMVGVQELVNQQGQKGTCLAEVNGLHTLHRLLDQRRLSQNINQFKKGLPQNKPLNCYSNKKNFFFRKRLQKIKTTCGIPWRHLGLWNE